MSLFRWTLRTVTRASLDTLGTSLDRLGTALHRAAGEPSAVEEMRRERDNALDELHDMSWKTRAEQAETMRTSALEDLAASYAERDAVLRRAEQAERERDALCAQLHALGQPAVLPRESYLEDLPPDSAPGAHMGERMAVTMTAAQGGSSE
jgi:hypothetical protein